MSNHPRNIDGVLPPPRETSSSLADSVARPTLTIVPPRSIDGIRSVQPTLRPKEDQIVLRKPGWARDHAAPAPLAPVIPVMPVASAPSYAPKPQIQPIASPQPAVELPAQLIYQPKPHVATLPEPAIPHEPFPRQTDVAPLQPASKKRRYLLLAGELIQYPFIAAAAILVAYNSVIGQWFVLAYIIYAILLKKDSRYSFGLALFLLITVPMFQMLGQDPIAENTAIYTYELLAFGTLQAIFELFIRERKNIKLKKV